MKKELSRLSKILFFLCFIYSNGAYSQDSIDTIIKLAIIDDIVSINKMYNNMFLCKLFPNNNPKYDTLLFSNLNISKVGSFHYVSTTNSGRYEDFFGIYKAIVVLKKEDFHDYINGDTLQYYFICEHERVYRLFGSFYTDILFLSKKCAKKPFYQMLGKLNELNILNKNELQEYKRCLMFKSVLTSRVNKPSVILRKFLSPKSNFTNTIILDQDGYAGCYASFIYK